MKFLREPRFFPLKMLVIYLIGKVCILYFNDSEFSLVAELWATLGIVIFFILMLAIACAIPAESYDSSPLPVQDSVLKRIKQSMYYNIVDGHRGLFNEPDIRFEENKVRLTYTKIESPEEAIIKIDAYILVLEEVNTSVGDKYIEELQKMRAEAQYMMLNPVEHTVHL
ncbi:hypothetical protein PAT3040_01557 [Paenibacillus agaridevorans]|uniref:Uncharacterized protein n=1 Tax=Paenibacillus agaridevorans TaxID=171404 RepID=A0A2R5EMY9_9BACL|nr:hypothetical protein [Paenibacillus agaridevorans]GBG07009.1 hypothetical protein PAT3040_01557 [Paenibacillus agaridevorans]